MQNKRSTQNALPSVSVCVSVQSLRLHNLQKYQKYNMFERPAPTPTPHAHIYRQSRCDTQIINRQAPSASALAHAHTHTRVQHSDQKKAPHTFPAPLNRASPSPHLTGVCVCVLAYANCSRYLIRATRARALSQSTRCTRPQIAIKPGPRHSRAVCSFRNVGNYPLHPACSAGCPARPKEGRREQSKRHEGARAVVLSGCIW